jgi:hypothetical protein
MLLVSRRHDRERRGHHLKYRGERPPCSRRASRADDARALFHHGRVTRLWDEEKEGRRVDYRTRRLSPSP